MDRPARFFVFTLPRTGGTLLTHLLNCHPDIHCDGEIFNPSRRPEAARLHLARCMQPFLDQGYGFKFHLGNIRNEALLFAHSFVDGLINEGWQMFHLKRRNVFRQALSLVVAQQHQAWQSTGEAPPPRSHVNTARLLKTMRELEVWQISHDQVAARYPHLAIVYEDDLLQAKVHQITANRCFAYVGLSPMPVYTNLVRTSTDQVGDRIENFKEVLAMVSQTKYQKYLP